MSINKKLVGRLMQWMVICFTISANAKLNNENSHQNIALVNRPGLYYEKVAPLRLQHVDWRVSVFIEVQKFIDGFPRLDNKIHSALVVCEKVNPRVLCQELFRQDFINEKQEMAKNLVHELQNLVAASELMDPREQVPFRSMSKRSVPLGIIGSLSKSLFGTMDQEDAEYINSQIDRLFTDQTNITQIIGQQIHITESRLQELHKEHVKQSVRIDDLHMRLAEFQKFVKILGKEVGTMRYNNEVMRFSYHMEQKINEYIKTCKEFIKVISAARNGQCEPAILTTTQLSAISREIQLRAPEFEFPLSVEVLRGEALARIVNVDLVSHKGRLIIVIHVPLLDRTEYTLYRLHPWPVPQAGNQTGSAFVSPAARYIAISADRRTFFLAESSYVKTCKNLEHKFLCTMEIPLHEVSTSKGCEIEMLERPTLEGYRRCDVRVRRQHGAFWEHLPSQGGWLYSLSEPEPVHVLCPGRVDTITMLKGAGVFQLSANCVGRTRTTTLTGIRTYEGREQYFYTPEISLNITLLSPELDMYTEELNSIEQNIRNPDEIKQNGKYQETGESLFEMERRLKEIGAHRRVEQHRQYLIYGSFLGQGVLIVLVMVLCCCHPIKTGTSQVSKLFRGASCKDKNATKQESNTEGQSLESASRNPPEAAKRSNLTAESETTSGVSGRTLSRQTA